MNPGRGKLEDVANTLGIDYSSMTDEELRKAIDTEINKKKTV